MAAIYTRVGTPVTGKQAEAYQSAVKRAEALKKELGIEQDVFVRVGGTVGQSSACRVTPRSPTWWKPSPG